MRTRLALTCVAAAIALGGCGGGGGGHDASVTTTTVARTTVPTFGGVPGAAQRIACEANVRALQQASDFYKATHGAPAPTLDALVAASGIQRNPSPNDGYALGYDATAGKVTATGACTSS